MSLHLFDRNFDAELAEEAEAARARDAPSAEEIALMLAAARAEGVAEGLEQGRAEGRARSEAEIEARRAAALETMMPQIAAIFAAAAEHRKSLEAEALDFAISLCAQLFPQLLKEEAPVRCEHEIRRAIALALGSPSLTLSMAPETHAEIAPVLAAAARSAGMIREPELIAEPALSVGEMRAEWLNGTAEFSYPAICAGILDALRNARSSLGQTPTPNESMPRV
ncbi:FliH/SctL family protein [Profundibacterium mesophilum]|uniref:Flagellar assembly protein FliH n=1 Tax=Profundibacterium mesophilum KAUST100406-0324 TaxID=1037889 RepID=A0A921NN84_9RHOB|nr:FliH/SctL family protein [Profundibacterium mesophilum]KAF0674631.1 putative Flagellar assembly protein FliH [Profundibacterium mesophilum KAUST100406-0324]